MSTAPAITFTLPASAFKNEFIQNIFSVYLYSNESVFTTYYNWATPVGASSSTYERNAAQLYSGYVLQFSCNISSATPKNGSGCCMQDASGQSGDGYCLLQQEDTTVNPSVKSAQTYVLTNSQFTTALSDPYEISSNLLVQATQSNILGFQRFKCSTFNADQNFICDKFQLWPAASYLGGFRFENKMLAKGYFYNIGLTGKKRWSLNILQLSGAMSGVLYSSAIGLAAVYCLVF